MYLVIDQDGNSSYTKEIEHESEWEIGNLNLYRLHEGKYQEYQGTGKWRDVAEFEVEDDDDDEDNDWLEDEEDDE